MTRIFAPSTFLSTIGCWNVIAAVAPPPNMVGFENISSNVVGRSAPCQTPQNATSFDMLPIQLNFVTSNTAALLPSNGSIAADDANIAIESPSGVALLYMWLAAASDPAPGILEATTAGCPGTKRPKWRARMRT